MNPWNNVRGFQKFSLCDWPGRSSAVIFFGGCNFRCPTCHNWQLATNASSIETVSRDMIIDYLTAKSSWLDGVVITGGEPTINPGLLDLLVEIKNLGFPVNLHTNGFNPEVIKECINQNLVEVFSIDVKGPWTLYPELTGGMTPEAAERNLGYCFDLAQLGIGRFHFRTTHVPFLTDTDIAICESYLPEGYELHIQQYREPEHLKNVETVNIFPVRHGVTVENVI